MLCNVSSYAMILYDVISHEPALITQRQKYGNSTLVIQNIFILIDILLSFASCLDFKVQTFIET